MQAERRKQFHGYVKVELQSRHPRRWTWRIYKEGCDTLTERAERSFCCAEDAWRDGQKVLVMLEEGQRWRPQSTPLAA
ncbi:hypothetical protein JMJ55_01255 [Belnapia sp. T6]|uniref:DUF1508 domain-containing protein n=1 Tax=Belnapia mucosa TaxID=2804532 RepID=A0ABS1UWS7_9PROT|nr:hypothetical protein [Belnapia mucosa]MBL6453928.1 hypothetical protein [Belnapia mucosa]